MSFIKQFLPRSLYGRAALILIVPVITIQFVVSLAFIQRHYEGVTRQMTAGVALELNLILDELFDGRPLPLALKEADHFGKALGISFHANDTTNPITADTAHWLDLSGLAIIETLHNTVPGVIGTDVTAEGRLVRAAIKTRSGEIIAEISRHRMSATNPHQLLVLMMITSLLMTLIAFAFLRNQLRPIAQLGRVAEAFGRGERLQYRPRGAQEVRAAGRAFLDMRDRLERQIEQRMLMLSGVSHDLRTPLTRMRLQLSLMEENDDTQALQGDVTQMQRMVDEFLTFVRDDATDQEEETDFDLLANELVEGMRRAGHDMRAPFISGQKRLAFVRKDAVARASENLLGNALRHAKNVELSLVYRKHQISLIVEDDGPGIPDDLREKAIQPFTRLTSERNPNAGGGVGLGLSIAADVATSHGGKLILDRSTRMGGLKAELILKR